MILTLEFEKRKWCINYLDTLSAWNINLPCCHVLSGALDCYLSILKIIPKQLHRFTGPTSVVSLALQKIIRNLASINQF